MGIRTEGRKTIWTFSQRDGLIYRDGTTIGQGYAGKGLGKNNPAMQDIHGEGPLPCGFYTIGDPIDEPHTGHYSLPLTPDPGNEMFSRSGFFWHGDNPAHPGESSDGCIVSPLPLRLAIYESADRRLQVVAGE